MKLLLDLIIKPSKSVMTAPFGLLVMSLYRKPPEYLVNCDNNTVLVVREHETPQIQ